MSVAIGGMAGPHILTTLRAKRDDIQAAIEAYEAKIEAAKRDLAAVNAILRLYELDGERREFPPMSTLADCGSVARSARYVGKPWNRKGRWTRGNWPNV